MFRVERSKEGRRGLRLCSLLLTMVRLLRREECRKVPRSMSCKWKVLVWRTDAGIGQVLGRNGTKQMPVVGRKQPGQSMTSN